MEKIVRQDTGEEEGISGKERENNEVEVTRTAINNAGTVTYMNLLYKVNVHGRYGQGLWVTNIMGFSIV